MCTIGNVCMYDIHTIALMVANQRNLPTIHDYESRYR